MMEAAGVGFLLVRELLLLAAIGLALSGLDDLFVDLVFIGRRVLRAATTRRLHPVMRVEAMGTDSPGWMAILVPAWDESAVIGTMLRGLLDTLDYPRYRIFVGAYPNDPATQARVRAVRDRRIELVIVDAPGPTSKADCLNQLWFAVLACETRRRIRFKAVVLHDAEDLVHRQELHVFDHLISRLGMVQLPVLPLPDPHSPWVAGHYLDEFAESHIKNVTVREALGANVPSAGVGCGIARQALVQLAATADGRPFDTDSFTEDYELGLKLGALGFQTAMVRIRDRTGKLVAVREYFPAEFSAAVRQKARWVYGIALAGWDRVGWRGGLAERYMLWRDRKQFLTAPLLVLSYLAMLGSLAAIVLSTLVPSLEPLRALFLSEPLLLPLLAFNGGVLLWRALMRGICTADAHGWKEGLYSVPRMVLGNLINLFAIARAVLRYWQNVRTGKRHAWDKTMHRMPAVVAASS